MSLVAAFVGHDLVVFFPLPATSVKCQTGECSSQAVFSYVDMKKEHHLHCKGCFQADLTVYITENMFRVAKRNHGDHEEVKEPIAIIKHIVKTKEQKDKELMHDINNLDQDERAKLMIRRAVASYCSTDDEPYEYRGFFRIPSLSEVNSQYISETESHKGTKYYVNSNYHHLGSVDISYIRDGDMWISWYDIFNIMGLLEGPLKFIRPQESFWRCSMPNCIEREVFEVKNTCYCEKCFMTKYLERKTPYNGSIPSLGSPISAVDYAMYYMMPKAIDQKRYIHISQ